MMVYKFLLNCVKMCQMRFFTFFSFVKDSVKCIPVIIGLRCWSVFLMVFLEFFETAS